MAQVLQSTFLWHLILFGNGPQKHRLAKWKQQQGVMLCNYCCWTIVSGFQLAGTGKQLDITQHVVTWCLIPWYHEELEPMKYAFQDVDSAWTNPPLGSIASQYSWSTETLLRKWWSILIELRNVDMFGYPSETSRMSHPSTCATSFLKNCPLWSWTSDTWDTSE